MNFEIEVSLEKIEKCGKTFEEFEDALQVFQEEMYSEYNDLLKRNKELKENIAELERSTQGANQIFNRISNELKENKKILQDKSEKLEKLNGTNQKKDKSLSFEETMNRMDTRLKSLNDSKVSFCIYKEIYG